MVIHRRDRSFQKGQIQLLDNENKVCSFVHESDGTRVDNVYYNELKMYPDNDIILYRVEDVSR